MKKYKVTAIIEAKNKGSALEIETLFSARWNVKRIRESSIQIKPAEVSNCHVVTPKTSENQPDPRQWVKVENAGELSLGDSLWGWSKTDRVRQWIVDIVPFSISFMTPMGCRDSMNGYWDEKHQPTHIMPRKSGEEPPQPPTEQREWMDAKTAKRGAYFWGWLEGDKVRLWISSHHREGAFYTSEKYDTYKSLSWDRKHQPTHVMEWHDGDECPDPPAAESIYDSIRKIYDSAGSYYSVLSEIQKQHPELYDKALGKAQKLIYTANYDHAYFHRLICDFALLLAKEGIAS